MLRPDKQALKRATSMLVRAAGGQEAAVGFTRLSRHQALSDYGNPSADMATRFAPIDVVADLEALTHDTPDHPAVTRQLARLAGYDLVRLPEVRAGGDLSTQLFDVIRETSEVTLMVGQHLRDAEGVGFRGAAIGAVRREIADAVRALLELDALIAGDE